MGCGLGSGIGELAAWEALQLELLGTAGRPDLFHHHAAAKNRWWLRAQPYFEPSPRTGRKG